MVRTDPGAPSETYRRTNRRKGQSVRDRLFYRAALPLSRETLNAKAIHVLQIREA